MESLDLEVIKERWEGMPISMSLENVSYLRGYVQCGNEILLRMDYPAHEEIAFVRRLLQGPADIAALTAEVERLREAAVTEREIAEQAAMMVVAEAIRDEREACAQLAEQTLRDWRQPLVADEIRAIIRKRST